MTLRAEPTISHRPDDIAVRVPLPDNVVGRIEVEQHPRRGSCLILRYRLADQDALIDTMERGLAAIRRGPIRGQPGVSDPEDPPR